MWIKETTHLPTRLIALDHLILDAISEATLKIMDTQIHKEIDNLHAMVERLNERAANGFKDEFESTFELEQIINDLLEQRKQIQRLIKMKKEHISSILRVLWFQRNTNISRCRTSAVSDKMLATMPTPPTYATDINSLQKWGAAYGYMA